MDDQEEIYPADAYLAEAIGGLAANDAHLEGGTLTKWILITEHQIPGRDHETLSIFKSDDLAPWARLGMLRFATLMAEDEATEMYHDNDEDEDEDEDEDDAYPPDSD